MLDISETLSRNALSKQDSFVTLDFISNILHTLQQSFTCDTIDCMKYMRTLLIPHTPRSGQML